MIKSVKELREEKSKLAIELKRWKDESINKNIELAECKSECQKKRQELSDLRKEQENWLKSKNASSNQSHNEHNESSNMRTDHFSEGWEPIVSKAQAMREQIIQKENDEYLAQLRPHKNDDILLTSLIQTRRYLVQSCCDLLHAIELYKAWPDEIKYFKKNMANFMK